MDPSADKTLPGFKEVVSRHKFEFSSESALGSRSNQEDRTFVGKNKRLIVVCDGVGGAADGERASSVVVSVFESFDQNPSAEVSEDGLRQVLRDANKQVLESNHRHKKEAGSTITAMLFDEKEKKVYLAWAGDSPAYFLEPAGQRQDTTTAVSYKSLVVPHSKVEEMVRLKMIKPEEAKNHPERNVITSAAGMAEDRFKVRSMVLPLKTGAYVVGSDGLLKGFPSQLHLVTAMEKLFSAQPIQETTTEITNQAASVDNSDNVSMVVAMVK